MIQRPLTFRPVGFRPRNFRPDSLAGYKVLGRSTRNGSDSLLAYLPPGSTGYTFSGGGANSERFVHVQAVTRCGIEQPPGRLRRVAFDANGDLIGAAPNAPATVRAYALAGGELEVAWSYFNQHEEVSPASFNVYTDGGSGNGVDYNNAVANVSFDANKREQTASVGTFAGGTTVEVGVRAVASGGAEETNTQTATATADASAPTAVTNITTEIISE